MGRRKIEMKMVENKSSRQVTFLKRRTGVFKKADELAILCGVVVAIIVFSPGGKPYTFGNPNVDCVIDRFMNEAEEEDKDRVRLVNNTILRRLVADFKKLNVKLDEERKIGKMLDNNLTKFKSMDEYTSFEELVQMKQMLEKINGDVKEKAKAMEDDLEVSESLLMLSKRPIIHRRANRG